MTGCKARLKKLLPKAAGLLLLGSGYLWLVAKLGVGLPCPLYRLTGWQCPGCGVTRFCVALLRGNWSAAWSANPALCVLGPVILGLLAVRAVGYVKGAPPTGWERKSWLVLAALLLIFGLWRNLC